MCWYNFRYLEGCHFCSILYTLNYNKVGLDQNEIMINILSVMYFYLLPTVHGFLHKTWLCMLLVVLIVSWSWLPKIMSKSLKLNVFTANLCLVCHVLYLLSSHSLHQLLYSLQQTTCILLPLMEVK